MQWGVTYLQACHPTPDVLITQVGDLREHQTWGPPSVIRPASGPRAVFNLTRGQPMSDIAAEAAAALAASFMVFDSLPAGTAPYPINASSLLASARSLYALGYETPGRSNDNNPARRPDVFPQCDASVCFYWTFETHVNDKLAWASTWVAAAEFAHGEFGAAIGYASNAAQLLDAHLASSSRESRATKSFSWDSKWPGVYALAASRLVGILESARLNAYRSASELYLDHWTSRASCSDPPCQQFTPGGLVFYLPWGALRYSTHIALLARVHAEYWPATALAERLLVFAQSQINYVLGANPSNRSLLTAFGINPPVRPHHRGASGMDGYCALSRLSAEPNRYELPGAMVGGPYCGEPSVAEWACDGYEDRREDAVRNEVALDYNAGFVAALAGVLMPAKPPPPPAPSVPGTCCMWPRRTALTSCNLCISTAEATNWLADSQSQCTWSGNPYQYTWCPSPPSPPPRPSPAPARPPITQASYTSVLIFVLEVLVTISSFIAALASLEKLFVLYTWLYFKSYPQHGSESQWKTHTRIDPSMVEGVPKVCVQCPIYNDREVCERIIDAACRLEYPSECLEVFVCDDSTDKVTKDKIDERVAFWLARGVNIRLCRRPNRKGFKAGNMLAFHHLVTAEYIAIFDSDFIPFPDFLLRTVPYLLDNPELGFVQGRWTYLNQDESTFTRWVEITLNQHIKGEQFTRSACRTFLQFNGSGGIWRKACMDSAGGWNDETLVEDMDLSLRAYLIGWHALWLHDVRTPNELPSEYAPYRKQQYRWVFGPMQLYKRCVRFIWQSSLPFLHKLYLIVFFFSTRSTSLIANSLFFTFLLPVVSLLHFAFPEERVVLPWWSALMLPILTTLSVIVHTPRSFKYIVLYVLYENVLAMHKAVASMEGMFGASWGVKWPVTIKAGRSRKHGLLACDWAALRQKIFVREGLTGLYLIAIGVYLSGQMRLRPESASLFWFYGIYAVVQGGVYLLFGLSLVDQLSFEPDLPEAMRRPYRKAMHAAVRPLSDKVSCKLAASPVAHQISRAQIAISDRLRRVEAKARELRLASSTRSSKGKQLLLRLTGARSPPLTRAPHPTRAAPEVPRNAHGSGERAPAPGLPWASQFKARRERFVYTGAHDRVASGSFVALPSRDKEGKKDEGTDYADNYSPGSETTAHGISAQPRPPDEISPPPSPPSPLESSRGGCLPSSLELFPAGDAALRRAEARRSAAAWARQVEASAHHQEGPTPQPAVVAGAEDELMADESTPSPRSRPSEAATMPFVHLSPWSRPSEAATMPLLPPTVAPPMRRHLKAVCQGRPSVQSDVSDAADGRRTRRTWEEGPDALDALGKRDPSPPARGSIELPSIYGQSEEPVLIPRLWRRVQKQLEQLLLSAPLWLLNALTAIGIWLCLSNLDGVELAENVLAFLLFALVLPVALIWAVGRPAANTHAAWASLEGVVEGKQHLEHAVQLLLVSVAMALSLLVTFYTSSSRFSRWLRCQWTWLPEHGLHIYFSGWNVAQINQTMGDFDSMDASWNATWNATWNTTASAMTVWQCGDYFFS